MPTTSMTNDKVRLAVIGGGAAGLFAAATALSEGAEVTVFEQMPRLGTKLLITGKGRCNVTNDCTPEEFLQNVRSNPRFLYSAINQLTPRDTMAFFEAHGVPLKTERGRRVFPVSDKARDILDALRRATEGASFVHERVERIDVCEGRVCGITTGKATYAFDRVILATGGASYPLTGSDGSGYALARTLGHTVTALSPSLVPLVSDDPVCRELQGLSLKNVALSIWQENKRLYDDFGEMLFTHFGISGPMVLSASAHMRDITFDGVRAEIDLKPALDEAALDARLLSDFSKNKNKEFATELAELLPRKLIAPFSARVGIDPRKKVHDITREERKRLLRHLKHFSVSLSGFRPLRDAIVTCGGVSVREVNPKTMMSRLVGGLYFAGEILDLDAYTGGFNLQIAFSSAFAAAKSAAKE